MSDTALLWVIAVGAFTMVIAHAAFARHQRYRLFARFYRDWERAASSAAASLERLEHVQTDSLEMQRMLATWRRQDQDTFKLCVREAEYWRKQLPRWARDSYLGGGA